MLLAAMPTLFVVVLPDAPNFTIVAVSDAYLKATDKSRANIVGRSIFEVFPEGPDRIHTDTMRNVRTSFHKVLDTRQPDSMSIQQYNVSVPESEGGGSEERFWNPVNSPVFGPDGTTVQFLIHRVEDVTEVVQLKRRKAERTEPASPRDILENITDGFMTLDSNWQFIYVNAMAEKLVGLKGHRLLARNYWDVFPETIGTIIEHEYRLAMQDRVKVNFEVYYEPWKRWFNVKAIPTQGGGLSIYFREITAQKETEEDRRQWRRSDAARSQSPDLAGTFNLEGRFTYANRALLSLWQKTLDQVVGKSCLELNYSPELATLMQVQVQQVIQTKLTVKGQTPFVGPAGDIYDFEYIFAPVLAPNGCVEAVTYSARDITERTRTEARIQEDNRRFRELLLQVPAAVATLRGPNHQYEWVNADYLKLVNRPASGLIGKPVLESVPELISQGYISILDSVFQTGESHIGRELRVHLGEDELKERYINFVCLATKDNQGQVDGTFIHATDVTDLIKSRMQAEESERQFRTLAESIPHLAWMADEIGHIFWYNRRWYEYTGTSFKQMEGWGWQTVHDPTMLTEVLTRWSSSLSSGEPFEMIFPLRGADGSFRQFLTRVEPVKDASGRVMRWFGTNTDITEQRRTEEELRRMNRQLEEFAYVASHDLQEPLRMVNIYTQLMLTRPFGDDLEIQEYAGFVRDGATRMATLIHDLLTFSRTGHNEESQIGTADVSASLAEALTVLRNRIAECSAVITSDPLPAMRGDTGQLAHVFQNILSNALKYRQKDVPPKVHISVKRDGNQWIVSVRDNGIGFQQEYAHRIFGLFKRLHKDEYPGTGLGLAICQRIIERYGGRIWAESAVGEGATFYFRLPCIEG